MDQITADINANQAQECLNTAKKLIQDRIKDLATDQQTQLSNIYASLTLENSKEYLATVRNILHEIYRQEMKANGIFFSKIALGVGCGTLFSYLFCRFTGIGSQNIPFITISGGVVTLLFAWLGMCSYNDIKF